MKRRKFIKNLGLGTAATIGVPYLLPSGRLFAATGYRRANHVVFCLFAGGVRNLESVHKSHGNLMPRTLKGEETRTLLGIDSINNDEINGPTLQEQGTLYKEFRFKQGSTGHYGAHATAMTGVYTGNVNINANPENPTIFELYRKHNSPSMSAKNAWWVSDSEGLYANLNYSSHPGYGANYGANYVRPSSFTDGLGHDSLGDPKEYNPEVVEKIKSIRGFCDANFSSQYSGVANSIEHDDEADKIEIENFINKCMDEANMGDFSNPSTWNWDLTSSSFNGDMKAVHFAEKIITEFQPELLVVNMHTADVAHRDFTEYANNLHKMDYALAHLWNHIQETPDMKNDTILIAMPEHGRNIEGNGIVDTVNPDQQALDHTHKAGSREIFALVVGPSGKVVHGQDFLVEKGESIDIVPTIANILGFDNEIPGYLRQRMGEVLAESFY